MTRYDPKDDPRMRKGSWDFLWNSGPLVYECSGCGEKGGPEDIPFEVIFHREGSPKKGDISWRFCLDCFLEIKGYTKKFTGEAIEVEDLEEADSP